MEWLLIFAMMLVTFIPRYLPFLLLERISFPGWFVKALEYVPIAVLTVIVAQNTFFIDSQLSLHSGNHRIIAGALAVLVAFYTKSLWWTLLLGGVMFAGLEFVYI